MTQKMATFFAELIWKILKEYLNDAWYQVSFPQSVDNSWEATYYSIFTRETSAGHFHNYITVRMKTLSRTYRAYIWIRFKCCMLMFKRAFFSPEEIVIWLRQTLNTSNPSEPELIHTSCRSESSNLSLVVRQSSSDMGRKPH